jgi:hypothetical protein
MAHAAGPEKEHASPFAPPPDTCFLGRATVCVTECLLAPSKRTGCRSTKAAVRTTPTITAAADETQERLANANAKLCIGTSAPVVDREGNEPRLRNRVIGGAPGGQGIPTGPDLCFRRFLARSLDARFAGPLGRTWLAGARSQPPKRRRRDRHLRSARDGQDSPLSGDVDALLVRRPSGHEILAAASVRRRLQAEVRTPARQLQTIKREADASEIALSSSFRSGTLLRLGTRPCGACFLLEECSGSDR